MKFGNRTVQVSNEAIAFQNPILFKELTLQIREMQEASAEDLLVHPGAQKLEKLIKHHTRMKVKVEITKDDGPQIMPPYIDRNHPLVQQAIRNLVSSSDGIRIINNAEELIRGRVDLKNSTVHGIFEELEGHIQMPVWSFREAKFTAEECAAMLLHECGHQFTYFEFMSRTVTTNQVLAGIAVGYDNAHTPQQREMILLSAKKVLKLSDKDIDVKSLASSSNSKVVETVVISSVVKKSTSELGSNPYDASSWEYLSDEFATRHGAGVALVSALDKLYRSMGHISTRSTATYVMVEALKITALITSLALAFMVRGNILANIASRILNFAFGLSLAIDSDSDKTYDRPSARMIRVRNQIVEALKNKSLSKEQQKALQEDLEYIDETAKQLKDRRQWLGVLYDFVMPSARRDRSQTALQKELEQLANNDLFAKAAELKALA